MMKKRAFDEIIKQNIQEATGFHDFGYQLSEKNTEPYSNYFSKEAFFSFVEEMKSAPYRDIYHSYHNGKGSELTEKNGKYGKMPPKMASVASSSRFCYLALRDGVQEFGIHGNILFEHECKITGISGNAPQLDAYIPEKNTYIEVKCHEIFDPHIIKLKNTYWNFFFGESNPFGFDIMENPEQEYFSIPLSAFGIEKASSMFDIKQLLCHLLGISSQKEATAPASLVYLFFQPKVTSVTVQKEIDEVFAELQDEISKIFYSAPIQQFIQSNHIQLKAIAEYSAVMEPLKPDNILTIAEV